MLRSAKDLEGYTIRATDGEIGKVQDFLFDDQEWTVRYMVADTGGWLTGRRVLISPNALEGSNWADKVLSVSLTRHQIEGAPSVTEDQPVSRQYEADYSDYYGYPHYWGGTYPGFGPMSPMGAPESATPGGDAPGPSRAEDPNDRQARGDPHLRSTREVVGYDIRARDGEIGHLDDFLVDDGSWAIESVVVATRDWLPGKKVMISPGEIKEVNWMERHVGVGLTRDEIKAGPEYDDITTTAPDTPAR